MSLFIFTYFLVYGAMHTYCIWRIRRAFPEKPLVFRLAIILSLLMVFMPILNYPLRWVFSATIIQFFALAAYTWLVCLFWFCCILLLLDSWNLFIRLLQRRLPQTHLLTVRPLVKIIVAVILIIVAVAYGLYEARQIGLTTMRVTMEKLPPGSPPIRVLHIGDIHLSIMSSPWTVEEIARIAAEVRPDVIVDTGDLTDDPLQYVQAEADILATMEAPLGKYAVTGNHEFYVGIEEATKVYSAAGFRLLRSEAVNVSPHLRIVGVDDPAGLYMDKGAELDEETPLYPGDPKRVTLLLKHRPYVKVRSARWFDLQLSGHSHGGQVFPFRLAVMLKHSYVTGLHQVEADDGSYKPWIYVIRGSGTWGPPMRVFSPPEVALIILESPALPQ